MRLGPDVQFLERASVISDGTMASAVIAQLCHPATSSTRTTHQPTAARSEAKASARRSRCTERAWSRAGSAARSQRGSMPARTSASYSAQDTSTGWPEPRPYQRRSWRMNTSRPGRARRAGWPDGSAAGRRAGGPADGGYRGTKRGVIG